MLAKLGRAPFDSPEHVFEVKWDGIRGLAFVEDGGYRLRGRSRSDLAPRYPELAFLGTLEPGLVLDGEIVAMKDGRPDFYHGMRRTFAKERRARALAREVPVTYVAFDVLYRHGASVMPAPLSERIELLREIAAACDDPRLVVSEGVREHGIAFFEQVKKRELEGVVAKRLDSPYRPGRRSDAWTKLKPRTTMPCVILGYVEEEGELRSLVLGAEKDGELVCVGRVGSGLTDDARARILAAAQPRGEPLVECGMDASWLEPRLFCTVSFLERTEHGLRAPVFVELLR